jgi:ABC-type transport system substrate-binding protein
VETINGISPDRAKVLSEQDYRVEHTPLPRILAVFFNQNQNAVFADAAVRKALSLAVDKQPIIDKVLASYAVPLSGPIPPGSLGYEKPATAAPYDERLALARTTLTKGGWSFSDETGLWTKKTKQETLTLRFSLSTSEASELKAVAEELKADWAALGVPVEIRVFAIGDLKETIMRPRKFDALFFGQVIGRDGDPYAFWHSSQRLDPGLNIASYTNASVDKILEKARTEMSISKRVSLYEDFVSEVSKDTPAIFMYAPEFLYVVPEKVQGLDLGSITLPSERFLNIYKWYIETDSVWKIFVNK